MRNRFVNRLRRGFTMAEVAVVITVGGVLLGTALPKFTALRRDMTLEAAAQRLARELEAAQHEAVRRNAEVSLTTAGSTAYTVGSRRVELPAGATFAAGSATSVTFQSLGPVVGGQREFIVSYGSVRRTVIVNGARMVSVR